MTPTTELYSRSSSLLINKTRLNSKCHKARIGKSNGVTYICIIYWTDKVIAKAASQFKIEVNYNIRTILLKTLVSLVIRFYKSLFSDSVLRWELKKKTRKTRFRPWKRLRKKEKTITFKKEERKHALDKERKKKLSFLLIVSLFSFFLSYLFSFINSHLWKYDMYKCSVFRLTNASKS